MSRKAQTESPFSARVVGILLAIAILSFGGIMVLAGWSPELRDRNKAGDHPFSTSALGYNGFVQLLEAQNYPVMISRSERTLTETDWGVLVLTLSARGMNDALEDYTPDRTTLVVLPKWTGQMDPTNQKWQRDAKFARATDINDLLSDLSIEAEIGRIDVPWETETPFGKMALKPDKKMQIVRSDNLEPIVSVGNGYLFSKVPDKPIYILSDPDMINTFGLSNIANARFAMQMINYLRYDYSEPIIFDATLHGFVRSENLMQMVFDVPFIGATLAALASALLLGWAALVRFGPPAREGRTIALGKQALADNSAGLVTMARRESRMAPGYLQMIRRRVAREIGAPKTLTETQLAALFDRLGPDEKTGKRFSEMEAGLRAPAANREDLMNKARDLYRWRKGIIGRSVNERK
ncbi:DUF4350 domain-containing protein [Hyphomonas pacifica]|uniref:Uncharacterized protein n=1 Tax=Hyphomonas pacifica TaxID=1280941 RepID=A0A062U0G8_9PROT|nr:hypothetical protein [Hyphomonas pacifica]KCZ51777.1 hypothetical protein HY2_10830 [Hyphomonas pacifica]RAN30590.1 hypothetical protein HY3_05430 [Hyphomonas pacifica]RAN38078.1 hypothetical protein HY11_07375 [Hyphomonas pacifica]